MSNGNYTNGYFVCSDQRDPRNSAMAAGAFPANQFRQVFMETYGVPHGGAFVTAAELHMEPMAYYPADMHNTMSMPYVADPMEYRSAEHSFVQMQESAFDRAISSPSNIGSPQDFGSPSVAGSGVSERAADQPYAKLIYEALRAAPNHSMILREIYTWFEQNTDKPQRAPEGKQGWKNSIRHNLSMNQAFVKVPPANLRDREGNKGCTWQLSQKALEEGGVLSTTRYRGKKDNKRRLDSDILHQRQGDGGRVIKRSPSRENGHSRDDSVFALAASDPMDTHRQEYSQNELYPSLSSYSYPSTQAYGGLSSDMSHAPAPLSSFSSDNSILGSNFNLYEYAGTPTSSASTMADSLPSRHSPAREGGRIKAETYEMDGVSDRASKHELFKEDDSHEAFDQRSFLAFSSSSEQGLNCGTSAGLNGMAGISMADELSTWPMEQFGPMEGAGQGQSQYFCDF